AALFTHAPTAPARESHSRTPGASPTPRAEAKPAAIRSAWRGERQPAGDRGSAAQGRRPAFPRRGRRPDRRLAGQAGRETGCTHQVGEWRRDHAEGVLKSSNLKILTVLKILRT